MNNFNNDFEKAIRFITDAMPPAEELEKPTLFHSIRVGVYLYSKGYDREICIAGLLHDATEDTKITNEDIENHFGKDIAEIVQANTKDNNLHDDDKWKELIKQCIDSGEEALIVKSADIIDNYLYYSQIKENDGIGYTKNITRILLEMKPEDFKDNIFEELKQIVV